MDLIALQVATFNRHWEKFFFKFNENFGILGLKIIIIIIEDLYLVDEDYTTRSFTFGNESWKECLMRLNAG